MAEHAPLTRDAEGTVRTQAGTFAPGSRPPKRKVWRQAGLSDAEKRERARLRRRLGEATGWGWDRCMARATEVIMCRRLIAYAQGLDPSAADYADWQNRALGATRSIQATLELTDRVTPRASGDAGPADPLA